MGLLEDNIIIAENTERKQVNCIGTALFITGELSADEGVSTRRAYKFHLKKLEESKNPDIGYLASWEHQKKFFHKKIIHLAVITSLNPILMTHRKGFNGPLIIGEPFSDVKKHYERAEAEIKFYIPRNNPIPRSQEP